MTTKRLSRQRDGRSCGTLRHIVIMKPFGHRVVVFVLVQHLLLLLLLLTADGVTARRVAGRHAIRRSRLMTRMLMSGEENGADPAAELDHLNLNFNDLNNFRQTEASERPSINRSLTPTNVTGQLGATVYLHCIVQRRGQKTVTWLRRSDYHILTVGLHTYTSDDRFSASSARVLHGGHIAGLSAGVQAQGLSLAVADRAAVAQAEAAASVASGVDDPEDWMLQIRGVAKADAGEYECQINTQHPLISAHVMLHVLAPHASIVESPELYVNSGSTISLTCIIHDCPQPLTHIFWYHQDKVVNYERYVNITMERPRSRSGEAFGGAADALWTSLGSPLHHSASEWTQISRLLIPSASAEHSGRYTCAPVDSTPAIVQVHVLHAEEHLARKSPSSSSPGGGTPRGAFRLSEPWAISYLHTSLPLLALELFFLLVVARAT